LEISSSNEEVLTLKRMQLAAYKKMGLTPPDFTAAGLAKQEADSWKAIQPGGSLE